MHVGYSSANLLCPRLRLQAQSSGWSHLWRNPLSDALGLMKTLMVLFWKRKGQVAEVGFMHYIERWQDDTTNRVICERSSITKNLSNFASNIHISRLRSSNSSLNSTRAKIFSQCLHSNYLSINHKLNNGEKLSLIFQKHHCGGWGTICRLWHCSRGLNDAEFKILKSHGPPFSAEGYISRRDWAHLAEGKRSNLKKMAG